MYEDDDDEQEVVWQTTVDEGRFEVRVLRTGDRTGSLVVTHVESEERVAVDGVTLMYGAIFGPDVADVVDWQARAIEAIDEWIDERA